MVCFAFFNTSAKQSIQLLNQFKSSKCCLTRLKHRCSLGSCGKIPLFCVSLCLLCSPGLPPPAPGVCPHPDLHQGHLRQLPKNTKDLHLLPGLALLLQTGHLQKRPRAPLRAHHLPGYLSAHKAALLWVLGQVLGGKAELLSSPRVIHRGGNCLGSFLVVKNFEKQFAT